MKAHEKTVNVIWSFPQVSDQLLYLINCCSYLLCVFQKWSVFPLVTRMVLRQPQTTSTNLFSDLSHDFFFISFSLFDPLNVTIYPEPEKCLLATVFPHACGGYIHVSSVAPNHIGCCILTSGIDLCSWFFICYFQTVFDRHETFWVFVCNIQWSAGWLNVGCVESFSIAVFLGNINVANVKLCVMMALTVPYHDSTYFNVTAVANSLNWKVCPVKLCVMMALTVPYHDSTYFKVTAVANSLNWKVCPYWTKLKLCKKKYFSLTGSASRETTLFLI